MNQNYCYYNYSTTHFADLYLIIPPTIITALEGLFGGEGN